MGSSSLSSQSLGLWSQRRFRLRHGEFVEDFLDDGLGVFLLGLGLESDGHAVAQDVLRDALNVLRRDEAAAAQEGVLTTASPKQGRKWPKKSAVFTIPSLLRSASQTSP